jgi:hypothetical protein
MDFKANCLDSLGENLTDGKGRSFRIRQVEQSTDV